MPQRKAGRRRATRSPKHVVKASIQIHKLSKAGTAIDFEISANKERVGTITIGRGSVTWLGAHRQSGKRIGWGRFAKLMNDYCYPR